MRQGAVGVCRSFFLNLTPHLSPLLSRGTQRLLSNSSGQRFGQTHRAPEAAAAAAEAFNTAEVATKEPIGRQKRQKQRFALSNLFFQDAEGDEIN